VGCSGLPPQIRRVPSCITRRRHRPSPPRVSFRPRRRYARTDEIGVPFAITIDFETIELGTVTLRERDSTTQVRIPEADVPAVVRDLVNSEMSWQDVAAKYPAQVTNHARNNLLPFLPAYFGRLFSAR